jgi:hypothetical protein
LDRFGKRKRLFFGSIQFRVLHSDFASLGAFIHILLVLALIVLVVRLVRGT